jgi:hypothetical protein
VAQAGYLGLQRDDGFLECGTLLGSQEVGIPYVGARPQILMLTDREMATPVLGMRRKREGEVPRHARRSTHCPHKEHPSSKRSSSLALV